MADITPSLVLQRKQPLIMIVGVVLAVAIVFGIVVLYRSINKQQKITVASKGEIIANFPKDIIPEKNVQVERSYSIQYGVADQPVVAYDSIMSLEENVTLFHNYLAQNQWIITHVADPKQPVTFWGARKGNASLNITFIKDKIPGRSKVTIAYFSK